MSGVAVTALERLAEATSSTGKVFPIGHHAVDDSWQRARAVAGAQALRIHDLRHEAISRLAESGCFQLHELQAISGHRDLRCLSRYVHLLTRSLATKMDESKLVRGRARLSAASLAKAAASAEAPLPQNVMRFPGCAERQQTKRLDVVC